MTGFELPDAGAMAVCVSGAGRLVARGEAFSAGAARLAQAAA
jgi:hypothetical protein